MRVRAVSDLHGTLPDVPACDLLLIGGDVCPVADHDVSYQAEWLDTTFRAWLERVPARHVVGVCGNHDFVFERLPEAVPRDLRWTYLQDSGCVVEGLNVWGTPWQPWFFSWAFNLYEPDLVAKWRLIPEGTDVLVLHGPPHGYGDGVPRAGGVEHTGSPSLLERIRAVRPRLAVFGHIHEGRGEYRDGPTVLANVSILDERYRHVHPGVVDRPVGSARSAGTFPLSAAAPGAPAPAAASMPSVKRPARSYSRQGGETLPRLAVDT